MKLSEFKVGDEVRVDDHGGRVFTARVHCIHVTVLYLDHEVGSECGRHGGRWICYEKNGHIMSSGSQGNLLELVKKEITWI